MSDDDDTVMGAETMEPESPTGEAPPAADFDDGDDSPAEIATRGRSVSEKTRALFAKAAAELKAQRGTDEGDFGEYDEGYNPPADRPGPAAVEAKTAAPSKATIAESATVPPAPSLDPAVAELRSKLEAREVELAERERVLAERDSAGDIARIRDSYIERGHMAIVEMIKSWSEGMTEEQLQTEVADLITGLSGDILKVPVPREMRDQIEARRALKTVKAHTAKLSKREVEIEAKRKAAEDAATEQRAIAALGNELAQEQHRKAFPFLAAEDDAAAIVFDVVKTQHKRDGTLLQWTDAARKANEYLEKKWRAEYAKRRSVLNESEATSASKTEQQQAAPQGIKGARTLTNAAASTSSTPPPRDTAADGKWTPERHRAETKRRFRAAFQRPDE